MNNISKIGILTYHRSHNYGALLQAIALHKVISDLGGDVSIVDYWPEYHKDMYKIIPSSLLKGKSVTQKIRRYVSTALRLPMLVRRRDLFFKFIDRYIDPLTTSTEIGYDTIVCGSDQIWRKQAGLNYRFNPIYFGQGDIKSKHYISYAASMGKLSVTDQDKTILKEWLKGFDAISVRERDLKDLLSVSGIANPELVLDPTLLLDESEWMDLLPISNKSQTKPYAIFYDLMPNSFNLDAIRETTTSRGLELIIIPGNLDKFRYSHEYRPFSGPLEMLSLIAGASLVFTSSFHGLAFSIIFKKEFFASFAINSGRAQSLLESIDCAERLLDPQISNIPTLSKINYNNIGQRLDELRETSLGFLKDHLNLPSVN